MPKQLFRNGAGAKAVHPGGEVELLRQATLLKTGALQDAIFNSANFSSIATDARGVIQIFNVGAQRMLGYSATDVVDRITPADISDPQELIVRAADLSKELETPIAPGFEALVYKASRGIEDIYELSYVRKDGTRFPALVSVTALRDEKEGIIGYLLIGTDNTARNQIKRALQSSEERYTSLFNTMFEGFCIIEVLFDANNKAIDYVFIEANKAFAMQTGLANATGRRMRELAPEHEDYWYEIYGRVALTGEPVHFVHEAKALHHWYEVSAQRFGETNGHCVSILFQDVTARKRAEAALVEAGALQNAIFNSANFSSIATDEKGVIQIFNVGAERMLGYAAAEVVNKITPADISDPQELIERAAALSSELATEISPGFEALVFKASRGIEDIYELTYVRKDRSRFEAAVSVTALRNAQELIIGYLLIGTDNTARKEVEAAQRALDQLLRDQQFYTRSLIESNIDALMTTDPQGIISDVNQQMMILTGRSRDELIGAPCRNFFTEPGRADIAIKRVLREHKLSDFELTVSSHDGSGSNTVVSYNAATFYNRERKLQGVFASARDMTERKLIERTLEEKNVELEHATRMKSEFLATMSHELRTPLNAIIGFSEALKDGLIGQMSDTQHEYIGDIFASGQHLLALINDILDLSKVEAGMMALELETIDLASLLSNSMTIVREKAANQGISLILEKGENLGVPQLDMRKTKQIVYNLLSNAVKFSREGGRVTLRARRVSRSTVGTLPGPWPVRTFPLAESAYLEFLEICVTDTGIGISEENLPKLFQAFTQIDSSLARRFEGTGLGLAMVKQLAELHGGAVAVASGEGEGSAFAVWLPLLSGIQSEPVGRDEAKAMASALPDKYLRLALVIEDDMQAAELMRLLLESEGFSVLHASTGEDALLVAKQQHLSLITLDLLLPGIGGWELLSQIRDDPVLARVPVVVVSAVIDGTLALARGASAVLQKPISRAPLRASLDSLGLNSTPDHAYTILIVDDDPKAVEVIAAFLPLPAYVVVRAYGGKEALTLAQRLRPDLILLDLMMPETSGLDVIEALQRDPLTATIPVLVVTAKQISEEDRGTLNKTPGKVIHIVEKTGFNSGRFIAEVRRTLHSHTRRKDDGAHPDS
jgi:PAS domain S-box-containing protein